MDTSDNRITTLEERAADQERTIEELSAQIAEQWKVIERLQARLDALTERFLAVEENAISPPEATRPPHW